MTRINVIPPHCLTDRHLLAEYRELPRVFGLVRKAQAKGLTPSDVAIPASYTMGRGHVTFFYDKLGYLVTRQQSLIMEMKSRGFKPNHTRPQDLVEGLSPHWMNSWRPDNAAIDLNSARIRDRLANGKGQREQAQSRIASR